MSKTNNAKFIFLILLLPLFLTGCYDRFELDNLAYVIAIGVDTGENGNVNITYQIAVPLKITGENSETGKETYTTYTVSAPSLSVGNTLVNPTVSKEINLSHVKLILYSEELAKSELSGHVNVFMSHTDIRPKAILAVCKGSAENFLNEVSPKLEVSPARYYELLFSSYNYTSQSAGSELINFYTSSQSIDRDPFAIYTELEEISGDKKEASPDGLAIFKGSSMVGILEQKLILSHLILTNNLKKCGYSVPDFNEKDRVISVNLEQETTPKIEVTIDGDSPKIKCDIKLKAHLVSSGSNINFYDEKNKNRLEKDLNEKIKKELSTYFDKTIKEYKADIAGIGRFAKANYLTWKEFEDYNWLEKYQNSTYEINVDTEINISQIISHIIPNHEDQ